MAAAAGALAVSAPAVASADTVIAQATIFAPNVAPVQTSVTLSQLQLCTPFTDDTDSYEVINGTAQPGPQTPFPQPSSDSGTWLLSEVLSCGLHISLQTGDSVEVVRGDGSTEDPLSASDLAPGSGWSPSTQAPAILDDGTNVTYYRPPRSAGELNAPDQVGSGPILLDVNQGGPPLGVAITAPSGAVAAGAAATFTATWSGQVPATKLAFTWSVSGGAVAGGQGSQAVSVVFANAGTYSVSVAVDDSDGSSGTSTLRVAVGSVPAPSSGTANPSNGQSQQPTAPVTGPTQGDGKTVGATVAPKPRHKKPPPAGTPASSVKPLTSTHKRKLPTTPAASVTTTTPGANATPATPGAGTVRAVGGSGTSSATTSITRSHTAHRAVRQPARISTTARPGATTSPGRLVRGQIIGAVESAPASTSPLVYVVAAQSAPVRSGSSPPILEALIAALVVALLFASGVGRELRWRRRSPPIASDR